MSLAPRRKCRCCGKWFGPRPSLGRWTSHNICSQCEQSPKADPTGLAPSAGPNSNPTPSLTRDTAPHWASEFSEEDCGLVVDRTLWDTLGNYCRIQLYHISEDRFELWIQEFGNSIPTKRVGLLGELIDSGEIWVYRKKQEGFIELQPPHTNLSIV